MYRNEFTVYGKSCLSALKDGLTIFGLSTFCVDASIAREASNLLFFRSTCVVVTYWSLSFALTSTLFKAGRYLGEAMK